MSSSDQSGALKTARELCFLNLAGQLDCQPPTGGVYQPVSDFQKPISVHLALTKAGNNGGSLPFKGPQQRTKRKCIKRLGQSANANSVDCFVRHGWHFHNASPMFSNDEMSHQPVSEPLKRGIQLNHIAQRMMKYLLLPPIPPTPSEPAKGPTHQI